MAKIDILMATYNGSEYLHEQIDSIFHQTEKDWHLIIRDDGSNDDTPSLLVELAKQHPNKITVVQDSKGNLGPLSNFNELCQYSTAPYCSFSDQDDIWLPDKLSRAFEEMQILENNSSPNAPLMVYADRSIIDSKGKAVVDSYYKHQNIDADSYSRLANNLGFCVAAGSTMLVNRILLEKSHPIPKQARMHDTWIELIATGLGNKTYFDEVALSYRRHDNNVSGGSQDFKASRKIISRALSLTKKIHYQKCGYITNYEQAKEFHKQFSTDLSKENLNNLESFISLEKANIVKRLFLIITKNLGPLSWERKLTFIIFGKTT